MSHSPPPLATPAGARPSFWRRKILQPILSQLTQGVTPDKIALTFAVGTAASMFPFLGFTSALNLVVGLWLRMNQPILQTLNQLLGPLHLVMIVIYIRVGEIIWQAEKIPFSVPVLIDSFREQSLAEFLQRFGWAGVHAATAWALSLPLIIAPLYYGLRPVLRRLSRNQPSSPPPS